MRFLSFIRPFALACAAFSVSGISAHVSDSSSSSSFYVHAKKKKWRVHPLVHATNISRLPPTLECLRLDESPEEIGDTWWRNTEDECFIAVNPKNHKNMIIVAHQDRYRNFLSDVAVYTVDGGKTWNESNLVLSRCQGSTLSFANDDFYTASDPYVTFDRDGNAYVLATSFNSTENFEEANVLAKSTDGGASWDRVTAITRDDGYSHFLDSPTITTDPYRKDTIYALTSDDLCDVGFPELGEQVLFQKSTDAGATWSDPNLIYSYISSDCNPYPFHPTLVVVPDKHKSLVTSVLVQNAIPGERCLIDAFRSKDVGNSWKRYKVADDIVFQPVVDPESGAYVGGDSGFNGSDIAVNQKNGYLYQVWLDPRFNPTGQAGSVISMSKDGGKTWSNPKPVNPTTLDVQTFLASVAVADDGTVGVFFYDFRNYKLGDSSLWTDCWVSFFDKDLKEFLGQVRLTPDSFDSRQFMHRRVSDPSALFIGDYVKMQAAGNDFVASFVLTNPPFGIGPAPEPTLQAFMVDSRNRQDVAFVRVSPRN